MFHRMVVVVALLIWNPPALLAQSGFRVEAESAAVHRSPSTGSPVIGHARRGVVLQVTRELGSWVRVVWPDAPDAVGYVHVSRLTRTDVGAGAASQSRLAPSTRSAVSQHSPASVEPAPAPAPVPAGAQPTRVVPPPHVIGIGAGSGSGSAGSGASVRTWPAGRVGLQFDVARASFMSTASANRLVAVQFAPSALYALPDRVTDYVWLRPYVGAGPRFTRQSVRSDLVPAGSGSKTDVGFQIFAGTELTFSGLPSFALSAGVQRSWQKSAAPGFDLAGVGFVVSGHWYVR